MDDFQSEFDYKDESWNEIAYLGERLLMLAFKRKFVPMPDNVCENTRVRFSGNNFRVESRERIPNRWVLLMSRQSHGRVYAVEHDLKVESDFTEIQFGFNWRNIAERVRFMVVDNSNLIFQTVEKGAFILPSRTRAFRFEHGRNYRVRIEVVEDVFSYFVDGNELLSVRVPESLAAREDDTFSLIFWEKDNERPILAEVSNFKLFHGEKA